MLHLAEPTDSFLSKRRSGVTEDAPLFALSQFL